MSCFLGEGAQSLPGITCPVGGAWQRDPAGPRVVGGVFPGCSWEMGGNPWPGSIGDLKILARSVLPGTSGCRGPWADYAWTRGVSQGAVPSCVRSSDLIRPRGPETSAGCGQLPVARRKWAWGPVIGGGGGGGHGDHSRPLDLLKARGCPPTWSVAAQGVSRAWMRCSWSLCPRWRPGCQESTRPDLCSLNISTGDRELLA